MFETNVNGLVRMTRLFLPHIRDGGHIVNMGSVAGRQAYENGATYVDVEVRGARVHVRAARGPARPADPDHDRRRGSRRDGVLARALPRATSEKAAAVYEGVDPLTAEDIADCVLSAP